MVEFERITCERIDNGLNKNQIQQDKKLEELTFKLTTMNQLIESTIQNNKQENEKIDKNSQEIVFTQIKNLQDKLKGNLLKLDS